MMRYEELIRKEKEIAIKRYVKLTALIADIRNDDDHPPLTASEKSEIGMVLADNMTPYEYSCDVQNVGDVQGVMADTYADADDFDIALEYIEKGCYNTVDDWIIENGLPFPDRNVIVDRLISDIDEEGYINDNYEYTLDFLESDCEFNLEDDEIIHLFEVYVDEPEDSDNEC